jgi:chromosome segregation ATPase
MKRHIATLVLLTAESAIRFLSAQTCQGQPTAAEVLKRIDELVANNRQLERQNQELMNQIQTLRQMLQAQAGVAQHEPAEGPSPESTSAAPASAQEQVKPVAASCANVQPVNGSNASLLQASAGNPSIFWGIQSRPWILPSEGTSTEN